MTATTGFQIINNLLTIDKDPVAKLTYTLDWSQWLTSGDTIGSASYSLQVRANDPQPIVNELSGVTGSGTQTYIKLSGGQKERTYTVTVTVTTANGLIDRRNFRVRVKNRSA
jgi:hypothetical protein